MKCTQLLLTGLLMVVACEARPRPRAGAVLCPVGCLDRYRPVCTRDGATLLWFSNPCWQSMCECSINRLLENVNMDDCDSLNSEPPRDMCPTDDNGTQDRGFQPVYNETSNLAGERRRKRYTGQLY